MSSQKLKIVSLLALSVVLSFFKIPLFPYAPFLTLDLSLLPILIALVALNLRASLQLLIYKFILLSLLQGFSLLVIIGNFTDFLTGCLLVFFMAWLQKDTFWEYFLNVVLTTSIMCGINNWLIFPMYQHFFQIKLSSLLIWTAILPFNVIKCSLLIWLTRLMMKSRLLLHL